MATIPNHSSKRFSEKHLHNSKNKYYKNLLLKLRLTYYTERHQVSIFDQSSNKFCRLHSQICSTLVEDQTIPIRFILFFNPFSTNAPLLYPLKTSKNHRFSEVFRGYRSGTLVENGLINTFVYTGMKLECEKEKYPSKEETMRYKTKN